MKVVKWANVALIITFLSACATGPQLAETGMYDTGDYNIPLERNWTAYDITTQKGVKGKALTVDGPTLNAVFLYKGLKDGDALIRQSGYANRQPVPTYTSDMFELELVEFMIDTLERAQGMVNMETQNVEPTTFEGYDAVEFDFTGTNPDGLNVSGSALMGSTDEGLNIVLYMAPSVYYYGKLRNDVNVIFDSLRNRQESS